MLRQPTPSDEGFIYQSWLQSYRAAMRDVPAKLYFAKQHALIERLLNTCSVAVYCNPENPEQICGYIVYESPTVHWVFVKSPFRRFGIASKLLALAQPEADLRFYTHKTFATGFIARETDVYDPYLLMELT